MELRSTTKHKSGTIPSVIFSNTNGYKLEELVKGKPDGKKAVPGARISVRYIGKLQKNGKIFVDYSKTPFEFILGSGEVLQAFEFGVGGFLPGVESGVEGMLVGGKRRITVPPLMGYGKGGDGKLVPPNAWLVFEVELLAVSAGSSMIEATSDVTTHDNGLTIEVLVKGKPDGKIAVPGKWIRALYTGKLQKNGEIFDSKFSKRPKTFCLGGDHKLGLGFSFGITGMHVGEIRKITVPPVYGFVGKRVPRHAWLVFQVELVEVVDDGIYYDYDGDRVCTCQTWQVYKYPCSHVIAVCRRLNFDHLQYVNDFYKTESFRGVYAAVFNPLPGVSDWLEASEVPRPFPPGSPPRSAKASDANTGASGQSETRRSGRPKKPNSKYGI